MGAVELCWGLVWLLSLGRLGRDVSTRVLVKVGVLPLDAICARGEIDMRSIVADQPDCANLVRTRLSHVVSRQSAYQDESSLVDGQLSVLDFGLPAGNEACWLHSPTSSWGAN
eukprot:1158772-Pelagomonas_calceolata.AAC.2